MTETKKIEATSGTELTRFNATRHGILSRFTVLPWESKEEYESVLGALVAEHAPQGPTQEHQLVRMRTTSQFRHWARRRVSIGRTA
jgi:hypothetical protein